MADIDYDDGGFASDRYASDGDDGVPVSQLINLGGALISLALVVGLGFWGYELLKRDVTGVPIVRALEGPMRVAPEDPGGTEANHQGLAVNRVSAETGPDQPADRLILAPRPVALTEDDQPMTSLLTDEPGAGETGVAETAVATEETPEPAPLITIHEPEATAEAEAVEEATDAIASAIAEALGEDVEPLTPLAEATPEVIPSDVPGVSRSIRAAPRPDQIEAIVQTSTAAANLPTGEVDPASITTGMRLVQLGAYPSPEVARAEWDILSTRFGDYFGDKQRLVQRTEAGGKTFYRLRAVGFTDLTEARRFCSVLISDDVDCIPVVQR